MGQRILVVAPHADDEVIGCAGLILSSKLKGASVGWLLMTSVEEQYGYSEEFVQTRKKQIETVKELLSFDTFSNLGFHPAYLDTIPKSEIILAMSKVIQRYQPSELYIPYPGDAHSDHGVTFDCCRAFMKPLGTIMWKKFVAMKQFLKPIKILLLIKNTLNPTGLLISVIL